MISKQEFAYAPTWLMETTLPYRRPRVDRDQWVRKTDEHTLTVSPQSCLNLDSAHQCGLPYGTIPRLLIAWLTTEVVTKDSPEVELGGSLRTFFQKIGLHATGGQNGSIAALRQQMGCLLMARFCVRWASAGGGEPTQLAIENCLDETAAGLTWPLRRQLTLSAQLFDALRQHAVPFEWIFFRSIAQSPMAIDFYWFLSARAARCEREFETSWSQLRAALGTESGRDKFVENAKRALRLVSDRAGFDVSLIPHGLRFVQSRSTTFS